MNNKITNSDGIEVNTRPSNKPVTADGYEFESEDTVYIHQGGIEIEKLDTSKPRQSKSAEFTNWDVQYHDHWGEWVLEMHYGDLNGPIRFPFSELYASKLKLYGKLEDELREEHKKITEKRNELDENFQKDEDVNRERMEMFKKQKEMLKSIHSETE